MELTIINEIDKREVKISEIFVINGLDFIMFLLFGNSNRFKIVKSGSYVR